MLRVLNLDLKDFQPNYVVIDFEDVEQDASDEDAWDDEAKEDLEEDQEDSGEAEHQESTSTAAPEAVPDAVPQPKLGEDKPHETGDQNKPPGLETDDANQKPSTTMDQPLEHQHMPISTETGDRGQADTQAAASKPENTTKPASSSESFEQ